MYKLGLDANIQRKQKEKFVKAILEPRISIKLYFWGKILYNNIVMKKVDKSFIQFNISQYGVYKYVISIS